MKKPGAPKIPNVAWREGRPRFMPGEPLRRLGYKGEDLKHGDGTWFTAGEALDWSATRAAEIAARRAALLKEANRKRPKGTRPLRHASAVYTLADLFAEWRRSPKWNEGATDGKRRVKPYSENTKKDYGWKITALEQHDAELYHAAVDALDRTIVFGLYEDLWADRGLSMARGCIAVLSSAISWGMKRGKVKLATNPAQSIGMQMPDVVVRFGEREEIAALTAAADWMGRPEIGDMVQLGLWTGQRQGDRLSMIDPGEGLVRGRRILRQSKTSAIVAVLQSPELERRLAAAHRRREKAKIKDPHVILDERRWKPWKDDHYRHVFAEVRAVAAAGVKAGETLDQVLERHAREQAAKGKRYMADNVETLWKLQPCPSVATLWDKHLRATAVVWMALGAATIPEIISVTGHTAVSANTILKHYLARHPEMADAAIGKMIAWFDSGEKAGIVRS